MKTKLSFIIGLILFSFVISSCGTTSSFPEPGGKADSILVIPQIIKNGAGSEAEMPYNMILTLKDGEKMTLSPRRGGDYKIVSNLSPGQYEIKSYSLKGVMRGTTTKAQEHFFKTPLNFKLYVGEVTVLDYVVLFKNEIKGQRNTMFTANIKNLTPEQKTHFINEKVAKGKNFDRWILNQRDKDKGKDNI